MKGWICEWCGDVAPLEELDKPPTGWLIVAESREYGVRHPSSEFCSPSCLAQYYVEKGAS